MASERTHARVVIIGAGQAGLPVWYFLQRRGLTIGEDVVILDRGPGTGGAWVIGFFLELLVCGIRACSSPGTARRRPR